MSSNKIYYTYGSIKMKSIIHQIDLCVVGGGMAYSFEIKRG